jgi:hypothetical protein
VKKEKIFVSIPALNEAEMVHQTIKNALDRAENPERVYFGVSYHFSNQISEKINMPRTETIRIMHEVGLGVGMSRAIANSLHSDQDYILQIDAHMLFQQNWDSILVEYHKKIKKSSKYKVVITQYPQKFIRDKNKNILGYPENGIVDINKNNSMRGNPASWAKPISMFEDIPKENPTKILHNPEDIEFFREHGYIEHVFTHASFIFSEPDFQNEVPPYPLHYYTDEQPMLTLRGWTRGYRFFVLRNPIVWGYDKPGDPNLPENDRYELEKRLVDSSIQNFTSIETVYRIRQAVGHVQAVELFYGRAFGIGGAPSKESWQEYMGVLSKLWVS